MKSYNRVVFVCNDNTCRSIMAEGVMNKVKGNRKIEVASRGIVVLFPEPINPKATAVMASGSTKPAHMTSVQLSKADFLPGTLVLTMTTREKEMAKERFPKWEDIYSIGEYAEHLSEIAQPRGNQLTDYGACYEHIDLMVKLAAEKLFAALEQE